MFQNSWQTILQELKKIFRFLRHLLLRITHLASDTDFEGTIKGINSGIVLGGSRLWILICSVFIACIGLDVSSPAVIIGAMLISPLMSPILGIGLAVGINDRPNLQKSLLNFGVATFLSLLTSYLYFKITPYGNFTSEMQARITPTILDAFVALFGGLAGIIAGSRTEKTNAIPGVAIATALMPPLCTSGFGLATGRLDIFGGAFYLFFINAVLISLSTYFIVRLLKFPHVTLVDPTAEKKTKLGIYTFLTLLLIPSVFYLLQTVQNASRISTINSFIEQNVHNDIEKGVEWTYKAKNDTLNELRVYYFGEYIAEDSVNKLHAMFNALMDERIFKNVPFFKDKLQNTISLIPTDAPPDEEKKKILEEVDLIKTRISGLEQFKHNEIFRFASETDSLIAVIETLQGDTIPMFALRKELSALYPELSSFAITKASFATLDTTKLIEQYVALVRWKKNTYRNTRRRNEIRLKDYLKIKLNATEVEIVNF